jgi:hypothetical protein
MQSDGVSHTEILAGLANTRDANNWQRNGTSRGL